MFYVEPAVRDNFMKVRWLPTYRLHAGIHRPTCMHTETHVYAHTRSLVVC